MKGQITAKYHKYSQNDCFYKAQKYFLNYHYITDTASTENKGKINKNLE